MRGMRRLSALPAPRRRVPWGEGGFVTYGLGAVWVSVQDTPLIKVDPAAFQVEERYSGVGGDCVSTAFGSVWLSNRELGNVWRLSPGESS